MNLTPEEEKQLKELLNNPLDFYRRSFPGFEFSSGHETLGHGNAEFCLTTDSGQIIHFYEQGNCKIGSNSSVEIYGAAKKGAEKDVGILIHADNGYVHIKAPNGDLVLEGKSVLINANDGKGDVTIKSKHTVQFEAPNVTTNTDNYQVNAALTSQIIAGSVTSVGEISSSNTNGVDALVNDSLVSKIIHIMEKVKLFFKSICAPV